MQRYLENYYFGENGLVYDINTPTKKIPYLSGIGTIGAGTDHNLAVSTAGEVYGFGTGELGQLGNGKSLKSDTPVLARIEENRFLENVIYISAGTKNSMALTLERKSICLG